MEKQTKQLTGRPFRSQSGLCSVWRQHRQNNCRITADRVVIERMAARHSADAVNRWWKRLCAAMDRCEDEFSRVRIVS
ncbi:MAG: hypothetical protein NTV22_11470 [bacterium]|nr:hypothetical protein [bacterium]